MSHHSPVRRAARGRSPLTPAADLTSALTLLTALVVLATFAVCVPPLRMPAIIVLGVATGLLVITVMEVVRPESAPERPRQRGSAPRGATRRSRA